MLRGGLGCQWDTSTEPCLEVPRDRLSALLPSSTQASRPAVSLGDGLRRRGREGAVGRAEEKGLGESCRPVVILGDGLRRRGREGAGGRVRRRGQEGTASSRRPLHSPQADACSHNVILFVLSEDQLMCITV